MAVYTVSTRTICEQQYLNNQGTKDPKILIGVSIPQILAATADDVLPEGFPVWNGGNASTIKQAILRHYWMREIGAETVALWRYFLSTRLQEIMPWYVDMYDRVTNMADIFLNQYEDSTDTFAHGHQIQKSGTDTRTVNNTTKDTGTRDVTTSDTGTVNNSGTNDTHDEDLYSDTPQNGLNAVKAGNYLTSADIKDTTVTADNLETRNLAGTNKELRDLQVALNGTDAMQYGMKDSHSGNDVRTVLRNGFSGDKVDVLERYRQMHFNVMQEIIKAVGDCWMGVIG